jgi:diadenosine tetraphosphate (Ap4A) HIT family hydrolase
MDGLNMLSNAEQRHEGILGHLLYASTVIAKEQKLDEGYRLVINNGKNGCKANIILGQSVNYLHLHLLGGAKFGWPPGTNC